MAFSFDLGLAISAERYGAISAGPEHGLLIEKTLLILFCYVQQPKLLGYFTSVLPIIRKEK